MRWRVYGSSRVSVGEITSCSDVAVRTRLKRFFLGHSLMKASHDVKNSYLRFHSIKFSGMHTVVLKHGVMPLH